MNNNDSTAVSPRIEKVSFSFDYHKQNLKHGSAEVYEALKTMEWRAKSTMLASD
jgi:hypothetical protein